MGKTHRESWYTCLLPIPYEKAVIKVQNRLYYPMRKGRNINWIISERLVPFLAVAEDGDGAHMQVIQITERSAASGSSSPT